jgi:hypothetical protein
MTKFTMVWTLVLTSGCAYTLPARTSGPAQSQEGVQVALVSQYCSQDQGPEWMNGGSTELILNLRVSNRATSPVFIHRDRIHLVTQDAWTPKDESWHSAKAIPLDSGKETVASLDFLAPGEAVCEEELRLDLNGAVTVGDRPLPIEPIHFVAQLAR